MCDAKFSLKYILNYKKPVFWVIVVAFVTFCAAVMAFSANPTKNEINAEYISEDYKISLKYPVHWKSNPDYEERFEGEGGFFQVGAINGGNMTIDEIAKTDAFHKLNPYGSQPDIINLSIDGQEARLILPSVDQPAEMHNQAAMVVKYPQAVIIRDTEYHYIILWADKAHIEPIGETLIFLDKRLVNKISSDSASEDNSRSPKVNQTVIKFTPTEELNIWEKYSKCSYGIRELILKQKCYFNEVIEVIVYSHFEESVEDLVASIEKELKDTEITIRNFDSCQLSVSSEQLHILNQIPEVRRICLLSETEGETDYATE